MDVHQLRRRIVNEFGSLYRKNDRGHRESHFQAVERVGGYINEKMGLGYDPKLIMLVAYLHDLFAWSRPNHHLMAGLWVESSNHPVLEGLSLAEVKLVADACREHRASYEGQYSSEFSELMACADRGWPGKVSNMVNRAVGYRLDRGCAREEALLGAITHVKEKFGSSGYARYPGMYTRVFEKELARQRQVVDALIV